MSRDLWPTQCPDRPAPTKEESQSNGKQLVSVSGLAVLEEMAGSLAHELNQPLTGILNNASAGRRFIAKDGANILKLDELFRSIMEDAQRAREIIRGIRDMLSNGKTEQGPLDLNRIVADVQHLLHSDAVLRRCVIVTKLDRNLPRVRGNQVLLRQALLNIVINALEAMQSRPEDKRRVIITSKAGAGVARVSVRDSGTGLPADNPEKIFEHFFSTKADGMGIGLAIARSVIVSHGGHIDAANAKDGGACISFSLPTLAEVA